MIKTPVPTDLRTRTPARRTHTLEGSRPGSSKLSVCAALSVVDFRFSPGRAEACTSRSRPPRGRGASSAAHAEHVLTSKCCAGRGGVGAHQRTATQHHSTAARLREIFPRRPSVASSSQATRSIETLHGSNQAHFERRVGANTPRVGANTPTSGGEAAHMWAQTRPRVGRDAHNSGPSWAHEWVWEGPRVGLGGPTWAREWGRSGPTSGPEPGPARRQSGPTTAPNWALVSTVTLVSTTTSPSYLSKNVGAEQIAQH